MYYLQTHKQCIFKLAGCTDTKINDITCVSEFMTHEQYVCVCVLAHVHVYGCFYSVHVDVY